MLSIHAIGEPLDAWNATAVHIVVDAEAVLCEKAEVRKRVL